MNYYEKRVPQEFNRMANITMVEYKKLLAELEVSRSLLSVAAATYERLVSDIENHESFKIGDREFQCNELIE